MKLNALAAITCLTVFCAAGSESAARHGSGADDSWDACQQCMIINGGEPLRACLASDKCIAWLQCIKGCATNNQTPSCLKDCDAKHIAVKSLYDKVYEQECTYCDKKCKGCAAE